MYCHTVCKYRYNEGGARDLSRLMPATFSLQWMMCETHAKPYTGQAQTL